MEKYRLLSVSDYQKAIRFLSKEEMDILSTVYNSPMHTISARDLSSAFGKKSYQWANSNIATIGKKISEYTGVSNPDYKKDICPAGTYEGPAYFMFVGPYFMCEGKKNKTPNGWEMTDNLCKAIEAQKNSQ